MFTSDTANISGQTPSYRNGQYITSASSFLSSSMTYAAFRAFNKDPGTLWHSEDTIPRYDSTSGAYNGNFVTTNITGGTASSMTGEWIQIKLPYKLLVKSVGLGAYNDFFLRMPKSMAIVGSNDGINWEVIFEQTSTTVYTVSEVRTINLTTTGKYSYFRLITRSIFAGNWRHTVVNISQINYKGDIYA